MQPGWVKLGRARKWTDDQRIALHYALCQIHSLVIFREVLILKLSIFITLKGCISQRVDRWWENGSTLPWVWMYPYTAEMRDVLGNTSPEAREISRGPGMQNPHPREIWRGQGRFISQYIPTRGSAIVDHFCPWGWHLSIAADSSEIQLNFSLTDCKWI